MALTSMGGLTVGSPQRSLFLRKATDGNQSRSGRYCRTRFATSTRALFQTSSLAASSVLRNSLLCNSTIHFTFCEDGPAGQLICGLRRDCFSCERGGCVAAAQPRE